MEWHSHHKVLRPIHCVVSVRTQREAIIKIWNIFKIMIYQKSEMEINDNGNGSDVPVLFI